MKLLVLFALFATLAQSAPGIGSSEPWPDVDDACYQMDKTCEIREIFILSICQSTIPPIDDMFVKKGVPLAEERLKMKNNNKEEL